MVAVTSITVTRNDGGAGPGPLCDLESRLRHSLSLSFSLCRMGVVAAPPALQDFTRLLGVRPSLAPASHRDPQSEWRLQTARTAWCFISWREDARVASRHQRVLTQMT